MNKLPLIVFAILLALFAVPLLKHKDPGILSSALIGKKAPDFALAAALPNKPGFTPKDLGHETVLVNFFASWCLDCRVEQNALSDIGIPVYGIAYKDTPERLEPWLRQYGDAYQAIISDKDGRMAIDWGVYGVPETFIVDKGVIRSKIVGAVSIDNLRAELQK